MPTLSWIPHTHHLYTHIGPIGQPRLNIPDISLQTEPLNVVSVLISEYQSDCFIESVDSCRDNSIQCEERWWNSLTAWLLHWSKLVQVHMVWLHIHYSDVIMSAMASQITGVSIVCSIVCSGTDQRKLQSSASLAFVRGIHRWPVDSPHKGPVTQKMFPFDDVIMFKRNWIFVN